MAFVDLNRNVLILKAVLAGPPAVGKSRRLAQLAERGQRGSFRAAGTTVDFVSVPLPQGDRVKAVELEVYEWHGLERADVRGKGLFVGLDGVIYIADAREDRYIDTVRCFEHLRDQVGKSRMRRLPGLLVLGQMAEGLLRLGMLETKLKALTWSRRWEQPLEDADAFVDAVCLHGEVMLERSM
jgi:hypothetical protein